VILQDFALLNIFPPAAALKPLKGNGLVWTLALLKRLCLSDIPHLDEMRSDPREEPFGTTPLHSLLLAAYRSALSKALLSISPVQPNQMLGVQCSTFYPATSHREMGKSWGGKRM